MALKFKMVYRSFSYSKKLMPPPSCIFGLAVCPYLRHSGD